MYLSGQCDIKLGNELKPICGCAVQSYVLKLPYIHSIVMKNMWRIERTLVLALLRVVPSTQEQQNENTT